MSKRQMYPAKIARPSVHGVLERRRLFRQIEQGGPAIWITGPAGSGKTMLAGSYAEDRELSCLWYRADAVDGDLPTFFYYMGLAARKANPRKRRPMPLLTPEYMMGVPVFIKRWFEELYLRLKPPYLLVFDNLQEIPGDGINDVLRECLSQLPDGIKAILISRRMPPARLSRLRASGRMSVIGWDELKLTEPEAFKIAGHKGKDARELHRKAGGWAAGLKLLIEAGSRVVKMPGGKAGTHEVFDYLASEVFDRASPAEREFLLKTSLLPSITANIAGQVAETAEAKKILNRLHRDNYFTELFHPAEQAAYRYHPLFREFLLEQASALFEPAELKALKRKAAAALMGEDMYEAAASLCIEVADWEGLGGIIKSRALELLMQGRNGVLLGWFSAIPENVLAADPWLLYWSGAAIMTFNPALSRKSMERALQMFDGSGDLVPALLSWAGIVKSFIYEWNDFRPLDGWIDWIKNKHLGDMEIPSVELDFMISSTMVGALMIRRPHDPEIRKYVARTERLMDSPGDVNEKLFALMWVKNWLLWMGELPGSKENLNDLRRITRGSPYSPFISITYKCLEVGIGLWSGVPPEGTLKMAKEAFDVSSREGVHVWDEILFTWSIDCCLSAGNYTAADEYLQKMERILIPQRGHGFCLYHYLSARLGLLEGRISDALLHAEKALRVAVDTGYTFPIAICQHCMAQIMHEAGRPEEAASHLSAAFEIAESTGSHMLRFIFLLASARFALDGGRESDGLSALRDAMAIGAARGYSATQWWSQPRVMAQLCIAALEQNIEPEYVKHLILANRLVPEKPPLHIDDWPWPLRIRTLGDFEVLRGGEPLSFTGKTPRRPLALLKCIIALGGREVPFERVADFLWPDADGDAAIRSFTAALHRLRKLLGDDRAVRLSDWRLSLDTGLCFVDALAVDEIAERTEKAKDHNRMRLLERLITLYGGEFLDADRGEHWSASARERLRNRAITALAEIARMKENDGDWTEACRLYEKGILINPLVEELYQGLMRCHLELGEHSAAARAYFRLREALESGLGVGPSDKSERLYELAKIP